MFQFVQPIWLWAAGSIIVPIIIHLWNVKEGKTLMVGSVALLAESSKSYAKSFKLSDLLLLLLRCLLLIFLAILLAKPFYEKQVIPVKESGWILIEKNKVNDAYHQYKPVIDSLVKAGYAFHCFDTSFKQAKFDEAFRTRADSSIRTENNYWSLLKKLDEKVPSKLPVYLFTDNFARRFNGIRPSVSLNLHWNILESTDTVSSRIQKAFTYKNDSIRLIIGNSNSSLSWFTFKNISTNASDKFIVKKMNGKLFVIQKDTSTAADKTAVEVDTSTLRVNIFTDKYEVDANYLKAAINAIKDFTKYPIKVSAVNKISSIPANCQWLFWLSEETLSAQLNRNNVLVYEKGKVENLHSTIMIDDNTNSISLYKKVKSVAPNNLSITTIWKDAFGEPVLSVQKKDASLYRFYSRFNPQWNDLTWSSQFPQIILNLLLQQEKSTTNFTAYDKRIIDASQMMPVIEAGKNNAPKQDFIVKKDLSKLCWTIAFLLFLLERIIALKTKKEEVYG